MSTMLEDKGIHAVIINTKDSSYLMFGSIELFVKNNDVKQSTQIIELYNE